MFVNDELSLNTFYDTLSNSKIVGIQIERVYDDIYVYVACSENLHFIISFSADESYLSISHLKSVIKSVFELDGLVCTFDANKLFYNINYIYKLNNLNNIYINKLNNYIYKLNKFIDINYIVQQEKRKLNGLYKDDFLNNQINKDSIFEVPNLFNSEGKTYTAYKMMYSHLFSNNYFILRKLLNHNTFYFDNYNIQHLKRSITISEIESNGIKLLCDSDFFKYCEFDTINKFNYNLLTTNGRLASDYLNACNILTIPNNETRKDVISKFENGRLFYFDYISLHPRLLLYLQGIEIPESDIYEYFQSILNEQFDRNEIKSIVYKLLYGYYKLSAFNDTSIPEQIIKFADDLYDKFTRDKFIITPYGREIIIEREEITSGIILSNYIQSVECDFVLNKLFECNCLLSENGMKSHFILYFYDGILLDYCSEDDLKVIKEIVKILETGDDIVFKKDKVFPVKTLYGRNFFEMKKLERI